MRMCSLNETFDTNMFVMIELKSENHKIFGKIYETKRNVYLNETFEGEHGKY